MSSTVLSGDSHLEIPCDRWTHRVPPQYRDRAPRRIKLPNGGDGFIGEGTGLVFGGTGQYSGRSPEEFDPLIAVDFDKAVGCGPPGQRLREQDADGVAAERVRETHEPFRFNPMAARERRIIHLVLKDQPGIRTTSEGNGEMRQVVVFPAG